MRFFIQYDGAKRILTVMQYQDLVNKACEQFSLRPHEVNFFYVDVSGAGEIPINSGEDFIQMTSDIEEAITRGNKAKPVIILKKVMDSFLSEISARPSIAAEGSMMFKPVNFSVDNPASYVEASIKPQSYE